MIDTVILLGNHIQGLGVARICRRAGMRVYLFNEDGLCVTRFSNTCSKFVRFDGDTDLLAKLLECPVPYQTALLMPTNDRFVGFMADHYEVLQRKYQLSIPSPEITDLCFNKIKTYTVAREMGIPIPESHFPKSEAELQQLGQRLAYPVIIKPAVMYRFYSQLKKKVFLCHNASELLENYRRATEVIIPDEIIVQEFLPGGPTQLYSFGSFCDGTKVWGSFVANRIRQKPMDFGVSTTFAKTVVNPRISELATQFLTGIRYFGVSEVEFMYDEQLGDFKLIEINPRTWKWHTIANRIGINVVKMLLDYLNDQPLTEQHNTQPNIGWTERLTDTYVVLTEALRGRLSYHDFQQTRQLDTEFACFSWRDPLPGIMYIMMSPYLLFKR
jgi:predicted ATP-grasp superfamily ATP-dependent carboligase